jgi:hypothetical protein
MARKDYAAIARARIYRPATHDRMPRMLVFGRAKKGKTRFCATAPDVLILDPEDGTKEEKAFNPAVWPVNEWSDVVEAYHFVKGTDEYKWVCLDAFPKIYTQLLHWLMRTKSGEVDLEKVPQSVQIQSYGRANEMVKGMLHNLHSLHNIGLIITCPERLVSVETVDDIDDDDAEPTTYQIVPDLPKGARAAVTHIVDLAGRLYVVGGEFERNVKKGGQVQTITETRQRRLFIGVDDRYETGYRSEHPLPDFLPNPTVKSVMRALRQGVSDNG